MFKHLTVFFTALVMGSGFALAAARQHQSGEAAYLQRCAPCHINTVSGEGGGDERAPTLEAIGFMTRDRVRTALTSGSMWIHANALSPETFDELIEYLVPVDSSDEDLSGANMCPSPPPKISSASLKGPAWNGWANDLSNTRYQTETPLTLANAPSLKLKWAFGIQNTGSSFAQPTVVSGRAYFGTADGTIYALDAATGCTIWTRKVQSTVRAAIVIAEQSGRFVAYTGDVRGNAYALDAETGELLWTHKLDGHPMARITAAPKVFENRVYYGVASNEESTASSPAYDCCTFRGSAVALEAATGKLVWKTYMTRPPQVQIKTDDGRKAYGPSGAGIWSSPTIDPKLRAVYVTTGDSYSGPASPNSDAIIALDLETGAFRWVAQTTAGDAFSGACMIPEGISCPDRTAPDFDFASSAILQTLPNGKRLLLAGQKSGMMHALDPDQDGRIIWQRRVGTGSVLGGIVWGSATDGQRLYAGTLGMLAEDSGFTPKPGSGPRGGVMAINIEDGTMAWRAPAPEAACGDKPRCSSDVSAALSAIPGAVFVGSRDGTLRAYTATDGKMIWQVDTTGSHETINGVPAFGGSLVAVGPVIVGDTLFISSGYGALGGMPGNVLLAYSIGE